MHNPPIYKAYYPSPLGRIEITGTEDRIVSLNFVETGGTAGKPLPACLKQAVAQIDEYFKGRRKKFSLQLFLQGTPFQQAVWRQLKRIPFGKTASYGDIARAIGNPRACRAVGTANGANPIAIIIPCHRIIGSNGTLTGYGGGLWRKQWLLEHEKSWTVQ